VLLVTRFENDLRHAVSNNDFEVVYQPIVELDTGRPVALPVARAGGEDAARLIVPLSPLAPGVYIVRYRVLAADGHVTEGALRFTIQAAP